MRKRILLTLCALLCGSAFAMGVVPAWNVAPASTDTNSWWVKKHEAKLREIKERGSDCRVVFYGDSITELWEWQERGKPVWNEHFATGPYQAIEFGYSGDCVHNLLWRLDNGEAEGLSPKVVVLQIGTNNTMLHPDWPVLDTVTGIKLTLDKIVEKFPDATIILCPIPAFGEKPDNPTRILNNAINAEIKKLANGETILFLDWSAPEIDVDGILDKRYTYDFVHPTTDGYRLWYAALEPYLQKLLPSEAALPATLRPEARINEGWWMKRLTDKRIKALANTNHVFDIVFCGDSITHFWENAGKNVFDETFGKYQTLNLGFSGDKVENLLWRLKYGELDGYEAKIIEVLIGTNNDDAPENVAKGIKEVLKVIREKQPKAKILLTAIFPRDEVRSKRNLKNLRVNEIIKTYANGTDIIWFDFNEQLVNDKGAITPEIFPDNLHLSAKGYKCWANALSPFLPELSK